MGRGKIEITFFDELPITIRIKVFKEGKALFVKDENEIEKIKWPTLYQYRDIYPLIEKRVNEMFNYAR